MSTSPRTSDTSQKEIVRIINHQAVTDSITLAEGTGSDHASVIKLVRNYQTDLEEFGQLGFEIRVVSRHGAGQPTEYALLNEHQATLLLTFMKNIPRIREFKKKLVKAFFAMAEKLRTKPDPMEALNDPAVMRGLLLTYSEKVIRLESTVAEQAPKVQALDRIATASGSTCVTNAAKVLQIRPKDLFGFLASKQWIYRRPGGKGWIAYQNRLQQGLLEHKITTVHRGDGSEKTTEQVLVTPKGLARLAEEVAI